MMRRFWNDQKGVAAIEAAIILPVLVALTAVSVEIGMMQLSRQAVLYATQQAALMQASGGNPSDGFSANVANTPATGATVACQTQGSTATCTGTSQFANVFAGVLNSPALIAISYTVTAQVPK
jgi:Flp pilus assembly protein TadG